MLFSFFFHYIFHIQLVGGESDSSGSESMSPLSHHGRSPLRNTTLMAVQSALSKHQKQAQVQQKWLFPHCGLFRTMAQTQKSERSHKTVYNPKMLFVFQTFLSFLPFYCEILRKYGHLEVLQMRQSKKEKSFCGWIAHVFTCNDGSQVFIT